MLALAQTFPNPMLGQFYGRTGMQDTTADALGALVGIYQVWHAHVSQTQANDAAVDNLRDQVYQGIFQIRQRIKAGDVSPAQALAAGQSVINEYFSLVAQIPTASSRARAEVYRPYMTNYAQTNFNEAALYFQKWRCPESTHTTDGCNAGQTGVCQIRPDDLANCVSLIGPGGTVPITTPGTTPGAVPGTTPGAPAQIAGLMDALGSIDLGFIQLPILPVVIIGGILLFAR